MKIYFAGAETFIDLLIANGVKRMLISYFMLQQKQVRNIRNFFGNKWSDDLDIFLDSGAFSAYTQGVPIDLHQYMNFLNFNKDYLTVYALLDVMGDSAKTMENLRIMEEAGLKPLAVYQLASESWDDLEKLCETHDYIALGGMVASEKFKDKNVLKKYLNRAFSVGMQYKTKFHAFGVTSSDILLNFPFYSADSTTWLVGGRSGAVMIFDKEKMKPINYKDKEIYRYKDYIEALGVKYEDVVNPRDWKARNTVNIKTMLNLEKFINERQKPYWDDSREINSEKLKNPGDRLPPETKGKIQEILKDPKIEAKRLARLRESLTNFRTGKYAENLPYYCNNCYVKDKCQFYQEPKSPGDKVLCALREEFKKWFSPDDFNYREENTVNKVRNRIIDVLLQRAAFNLWAELLDGGIQDRSLTNLLMAVLDRLDVKQSLIQQINKEGGGDIVLVSVDDIKKALEGRKNGNSN
jgi:hypothetical protein